MNVTETESSSCSSHFQFSSDPRKLGAEKDLESLSKHRMQQGGSCPMDFDAQVQANVIWLELNLMIQAESERIEHVAMMAAARNQPAYLSLAHPDPVLMERRHTARYLTAGLGISVNSQWRGDWSLSRVWEHLGETAVLTDDEKEFQNLCWLP